MKCQTANHFQLTRLDVHFEMNWSNNGSLQIKLSHNLSKIMGLAHILCMRTIYTPANIWNNIIRYNGELIIIMSAQIKMPLKCPIVKWTAARDSFHFIWFDSMLFLAKQTNKQKTCMRVSVSVSDQKDLREWDTREKEKRKK